MEALATEVKTKLLPTAETVHSMLTDLRPKIETLLTNASETSGIFRGQLERLDATVNDVLDRARLQVIRADEFLNRTMDRVEEATEAVHKTVVSPVRQVSGLFRGLSVGVEALLGGRRRRRHERSVEQDEMCIYKAKDKEAACKSAAFIFGLDLPARAPTSPARSTGSRCPGAR